MVVVVVVVMTGRETKSSRGLCMKAAGNLCLSMVMVALVMCNHHLYTSTGYR